MSKKEEKATIEVKPVSWTDGKVNKYQAFGKYKTKCICGDPKPTESDAVDSLLEEVAEWIAAVKEINAKLSE